MVRWNPGTEHVKTQRQAANAPAGLSKARPISCGDCPTFGRLQTSLFSIAKSPNRIPGLMLTPPFASRLAPDGVASTY